MTKASTTTALSAEALLGKSKAYIGRALAAKARKDTGEYQLWASLAFELLGKAALAKVHPCLVADPTSSASMFSAAGLHVGTDIKTIGATTLFERLTHLSKRFDKKTKEFCINQSLRRNAELHSGEAAFEGIALSLWEGRFWHTVEIVLEVLGSSIDAWIGADQAKASNDIVAEYTHAIIESAKIKVETASDAFEAKSKKERTALQENAAATESWQIRRSFRLLADEFWPTECPACESKAFLAGVKYNEEISDDQDYESDEEAVNVFYVAEELFCPACQLHLDNRNSIEAANVSVEYEAVEMRQREYEPDYGND